MDCVNLPGCPFYHDKMPMDKGMGAIYKKKYCQGNQLQCARYIVRMEAGPEYVPSNLYPNMVDVAQKILSEVKESGGPSEN
ncbi:MAG: hypothetical protein AB7C89_00930 [Intestinibacillus sp.]